MQCRTSQCFVIILRDGSSYCNCSRFNLIFKTEFGNVNNFFFFPLDMIKIKHEKLDLRTKHVVLQKYIERHIISCDKYVERSERISSAG